MARSKNIGSPPTFLKDLTGELTPPDIDFKALLNKSFDCERLIFFIFLAGSFNRHVETPVVIIRVFNLI